VEFIRCGESLPGKQHSKFCFHDKQVKVATHYWTDHLGKFFTKLPNIKVFQHFFFSSSQPGIVTCLRNLGDEPTPICILKKNVEEILTDNLPPIVEPIGLSLERQQYLFKEIRPFCQSSTSLVAPQPAY